MASQHGSEPNSSSASTSVTTLTDGLRKTTPYWYEFQTYSKLRWFGRELIEIMTTEFRDRTKEYYVWAIHKGICTFPEGEIVCKEPILTIDRQSGVNIVHPKGKYCETIFVRLSYDASTDSSVVFCRPITGRTHQIRVHVQYLGHPICNDPIYGHDIWSKVDPSSFAEVIPDQWKKVGGEIGQKEVEKIVDAIKGDQDGQEDWARWKDEVLFKDMIAQEGLENVYVPGPNGRSSRPSDDLLRRALQKLELDSGEIPAKGLNRPADIETAWQKPYLLTSLNEFPRELAKELKHEKHIGGANKRARWKAKELRKALAKKEGKKLGTQKTTPGLISKPSVLRDDDADAEVDSQDPETVEAVEDKQTTEEALPMTSGVSDAGTEDGSPFPSEVKLLSLLDSIWESSLPQLHQALANWTRIIESTTSTSLTPSLRTYRATVDRATYNLPSLNSQTMERYVGELAWDWLNGPDHPNTDRSAPTPWKVDLEKPLLDITLKFFPGFGIGDEFEKELSKDDDPGLKTEGQIAFMLKLPAPVGQHARRPPGRNALLVGGTAMAEYRAASLALALPLALERKTKEDVQSGEDLEPVGT
ncbi:hypothetical protein NDA16_003154 [Ustilago loliicola]|nr:hypothetical protein NDA16_003154 [Ustilago loliicola]